MITSRPLFPSKDSILHKTTELGCYMHPCFSFPFKLTYASGSRLQTSSSREIKANSRRGKKNLRKNIDMCFLDSRIFAEKMLNTKQEKDKTIFIFIHHPAAHSTLRFSVCVFALLNQLS